MNCYNRMKEILKGGFMMNKTQKQLLELVSLDMIELSKQIKEGDIDNYLEIIDTHHKLLKLVKKGRFACDNLELVKTSEKKTLKPLPNSEEDYQFEIFNYFKNNKGSGVVEEFKKYRENKIKRLDEVFEAWVESKAKFRKNGIPDGGDVYATILKQWRDHKSGIKPEVLITNFEDMMEEDNEQLFVDFNAIEINTSDIENEFNMQLIDDTFENNHVTKQGDFVTKDVVKDIPKLEEIITGIFKLQTLGGSVNNVVIPEKQVRQYELEPGDLVTLKHLNNNTNFPYAVTIDQRQAQEVDNKVGIFDYGFVAIDDYDRYIVTENKDGSLLAEVLNLPNYFYTISTKYIKDFNIQEGDLVQLRWILNDPYASMRVAWVYDMGNESKKTISTRMLEAKKEKVEVEEDTSNSHKFDLEGKNILVIGKEDKWPGWKDIVEANNGVFNGFEKGSKSTLEVLVKDADIVLNAIFLNSHQAFWDAKELCKKYDKPYLRFDGSGNNAVIIRIKKHYEELEEKEEVIPIETFAHLEKMIEVFNKELNKDDLLAFDYALNILEAKDTLNLNRSQRRSIESNIRKIEKYVSDIKTTLEV